MKQTFRTFSSGASETPQPLTNSPFTPPLRPWQPPIYFLSLLIWLQSILHINETIRRLGFCDWTISLSLMSSRFMHVVACGRIPWIIFRRVYFPHVYLVIHQWDTQVASTSSCLLWKRSYRRGCEVVFLFSPVLMPIIKWHIKAYVFPFHFCHFKAKVN